MPKFRSNVFAQTAGGAIHVASDSVMLPRPYLRPYRNVSPMI